MSQNATVSSTNPKVSSINPTALLFGELHNLKTHAGPNTCRTKIFIWKNRQRLRGVHAQVSYYCMGGLWHSPMVIRHFHISHNAPYPPPPTPPPKKKLHNLCFSFLLGITTVPRETENNTYADFFFGGGAGGGGGANKMHYGKCGSVESEKTLGTGLAYMLILRWKKAKLRGHSTPSSKSSIVKMIWTLIMRRQRPTYQTYTLILFNETNSQPREDWARFSRLG